MIFRLVSVALVAVFFFGVGRAYDHEAASAGPAAGGVLGGLVVEQATYQGKGIRWWARRAVQNRKNSNARGQTILRLRGQLTRQSADLLSSPTVVIRLVFGGHADEALRVAWCESKWHTGAENGQYMGLFQMGSGERARYGHSASALGQARSAYRYFVASGLDWSPWSCKP